jgi:hypothetical protein
MSWTFEWQWQGIFCVGVIVNSAIRNPGREDSIAAFSSLRACPFCRKAREALSLLGLELL